MSGGPEDKTLKTEALAYATPAATVLGFASPEDAFPPAAREAFAALTRPPDIDWQGAPVWATAYVTALRAIAVARHHDRRSGDADAQRAFNTRWAAKHLGGRALQALREPFVRQLGRAARNVRLANNLLLSAEETLPSAAWTAGSDARRGVQAYVADSLRWFSVSPPTMSEKTRLERTPELPNAFLVVAPPATGKTKLGADWLVGQGVGRAEGMRALWVTEGQTSVKDLLHPDKTLRRCLPPGASVTAVWQDHKTADDVSGTVVGATKESFEAGVESGLIWPDDFDVLVLDEADVMMTELKMGTVRRFDACKKLLLTATPSRSERRDLQRIVHHIRPLTPLEAIEKGVTTPVTILTFMARDAEHAEQLAVSVALNLFIKHGKKVVAYCQPGGGNAQASRIAEAVRLHAPVTLGEAYDSSVSYAEMVGSMRKDSDQIIESFERAVSGRFLSTTSKLGRAWNMVDLEGCIFVQRQGDWVALNQEVGRPTRIDPNNPGKIALIVQIKVPPRPGEVDYAVEMIYGLETVTSGITVGGSAGVFERGKSSSDSATPPLDPEVAKLIEQLPASLREALVPLGRPLSEVLLAPDDPRYNQYVRPEGYDTKERELLEQYPEIRREWLRQQLKKFQFEHPDTQEATVGVSHVDIYGLSPETGASADRYYDTAALGVFLASVDIPKIAAADSLTQVGLSERLGVPRSIIRAAAKVLKIVIDEQTLPEGRGARTARRFNADQIRRITDWVDALPVADDTKVWYTELTKQYGTFVPTYFARIGVKAQTCLHAPDSGMNGIGPYVEIEDATALKREYRRIKTLMRTHRSLADISRRTNTPRQTIMRQLTDKERAYLEDPTLRFSPIGGSKKAARHLPNKVADAVESRILNQQLGPHEVPRRAIADWLGISSSRVVQLAGKDASLGYKRIGPQNASAAVYHIASLARLAAYYRRLDEQLRPGHGQRPSDALLARLHDIDYDLLPQPDADPTPEQAAYARRVQRDILNIPDALLVAPPEASAGQEEAVVAEASISPVAIVPAAPDEPPAAPPPQPEPAPVPAAAPVVVPPAAPRRQVAIEDIVTATGRSRGSVENAVRQLRIVCDEYLSADDADRVQAFLAGGKGKKAEGPAPAAAEAVMPAAPPAAAAAPPPSASVPDELEALTEPGWVLAGEVCRELHATAAALAYMIPGDSVRSGMVRILQNGTTQIKQEFIRVLKVRARRIALTDNGWMTHGRLAKNLELPENQLVPFMRRHSIQPTEQQARVANCGSTAKPEYDVAYADPIWKRVMAAHAATSRRR